MLLVEDDLVGDPADAVRRDPEVRQARSIADAARSRLFKCVGAPGEVVDVPAARRMLEAFAQAQAFAEDAEDRVAVRRGLLTPAEADHRAVARRPAASPAPARVPPEAEAEAQTARWSPGILCAPRTSDPAGVAGQAREADARRVAVSVAMHALLPAAAGFAGAALASRIMHG